MFQSENAQHGPNKNFIKQFDYGTSEHLWMSIFMQKIRKNEWTGSSGTVWKQICWHKHKMLQKDKMHNLDQIRMLSWKNINMIKMPK